MVEMRAMLAAGKMPEASATSFERLRARTGS